MTPEEELAYDEPVGVTEAQQPVFSAGGAAHGPRRWITADDVNLLFQWAGANESGAAPPDGLPAKPLAARLVTHIDAADEHGWTLIMHAALRSLPNPVASLLEAGADVGVSSTLLKRVENGAPREFARGATALSVANAALPAGSSEDSDASLVVSMLRGPSRRAGVPLGSRLAADEPAAHEQPLFAPYEQPPPLASVCSWLPASALPAHYHQSPEQPSETAEDAAVREYREALAEGASLRGKGEFAASVAGFQVAVTKYAGAALREDQYVLPEKEVTGAGLVIQRQSWDVINQERTVEWKSG